MTQQQGQVSIKEIHWLMDMLQSIDVGLIVLDDNFKIQLWNSFMENHSGMTPQSVAGKDLLDLFQNIPANWFRRKLRSVCTLESPSYTTWEQRPYLLKFKSYHPITGRSDFMYQNITFMPLMSVDGNVDRVGIIISDVTDIAVNKLKLKQANKDLAALSRTDGLTQLNNRAYWEECLSREFMRVKRSKQPSSLVMFDIDHFKKVNDTYGHQAGDEVIKNTSLTLRKIIRLSDIPGRYGGEEFTIILVDTNAPNGNILAERLREEIEAQIVKYDEHSIKWTISLGVAELTDDVKSHKEWIERADQALYQAKESGRNKSVIYKDK